MRPFWRSSRWEWTDDLYECVETETPPYAAQVKTLRLVVPGSPEVDCERCRPRAPLHNFRKVTLLLREREVRRLQRDLSAALEQR